MGIFGKKRVYMDFASSTPVSNEALKSFVLSESLTGNAFSIHKDGVACMDVLENAKKEIASVMRGRPEEVFFFSSGTESDNVAIRGVFERALRDGVKNPHAVTTTIEHEAVLGVFNELEKNGLSVSYIAPEENGVVDPRKIRDAMKKETVIVSVMYVNNELGTIQNIKEISKEIRHFRKNNPNRFESQRQDSVYPIFHTDACQATNFLSLDVPTLGFDMLTLNGAKCYGCKGSALLYVKKGLPIDPVFFSKGKKDISYGTPAVALSSSLAKSIQIACSLKDVEYKRIDKLNKYIREYVEKNPALKDRIVFTTKIEDTIPGTVHMLVKGITGELVVIEMDALGVSVSSQSACREDSKEDSYVVKEIIKIDSGWGTLRVSLGRTTSKKDCMFFLKCLEKVVNKYS